MFRKTSYFKFKQLVALLLVFMSFTAIAQKKKTYQWTKTAGSLTVFQPGDAIRIHVWELYEDDQKNPNLSADYPIHQDGSIIIPLIGQIMVKGLTVHELQKLLEEKLKAYLRNPYVMIRPLIRVTMQGAFNRPGSYRVDPSHSLWDLVAAAGGPRADCDLRKIWVERGGQVVIDELLRSFEKGYSLEEVGIETGDQIIAPRRSGLNLNVIIGIVNLVASIVLLYLRLRRGSW
ncbi:polysaccharide biosynthesis/export family protein [bacterium]|nr:polysaccharide biosynthesis/export family protein [bacterium]